MGTTRIMFSWRYSVKADDQIGDEEGAARTRRPAEKVDGGTEPQKRRGSRDLRPRGSASRAGLFAEDRRWARSHLRHGGRASRSRVFNVPKLDTLDRSGT